MTVLTETRERFLLTIAKHVPAERIAEIHFFSPIKQGGVESGVAVVAAIGEPVLDVEQPADVPAPDAELPVQEEASQESLELDGAEAAADASPIEAGEGAEASDASEAPAANDAAADGDSPDMSSLNASEPAQPEGPPKRLVIYTARYRLTLKGLDRGKWETHVTAEADAPLVTVDAVVRGVQRRSGDVDDAARLDGDEVRALLEAKAALVASSLSPQRTAGN